MSRWRPPWPRSLTGQLAWILFAGVTLALLASAAIHLHDRTSALSNVGGLQTAYRLAAIVRVLDPLPRAEREKIIAILDSPWQYVHLLAQAPDTKEMPAQDERAAFVQGVLKRFLGDGRPLQVAVTDLRDEAFPPDERWRTPPFPHAGRAGPPHHWRRGWGMAARYPTGISFVARVRLADGSWAEFHNHLPEEVFTWPWHLLWSLLILFIVVFALAALASRLVTRPLARLAEAARTLGGDVRRPPLEEFGTIEVRQVVRAFNAMQARLVRHLQERSHILAAISHDLRTPLTRMRLRVEMMPEGTGRDALLANLTEMEGMTNAALDYIQGMEGMEEKRLVDIPSLLEELAGICQELGQEVEATCEVTEPFPLMRKGFKRCLVNLIDNAVKYGKRARVRASLHGDRLVVTIADDGPGIPEAEMARMLAPFVRMEDSRNRLTGGAGLGLSIAHNIVRAHQGELTLRNRPEGGLEVTVTIPRGSASDNTYHLPFAS
ncbi:MAG: HAMP domain-containing protein [Magnetococcales bacterium]|nr:HAMP domain-containing protein [Magnetococcales bacterium]